MKKKFRKNLLSESEKKRVSHRDLDTDWAIVQEYNHSIAVFTSLNVQSNEDFSSRRISITVYAQILTAQGPREW